MDNPDITRSPYHIPIRRPVAVTMIVLTAVVFGILSYRLLPITMLPDITYPSLTVRTEYPGAAPVEVESGVTRPLEQALGVVRNLASISSSSRVEVSDILLEFTWDTDMDQAVQDVREKLDVVFLPEDVKPPLILRYDPSLDPTIRLGLTSDSLSLLDLRELCETLVKRELEKLDGIAAVKVKGGEEAEVRVALDVSKLALLNIPMSRVWQRLAAENVNVAGGRLKEGETEYVLRALSEFRSLSEVSGIVIDYRSGAPIRLSDVATVNRIGRERTEITRVGGLESVEIEVYKESDANPITVSDLVKKRLFGDRKTHEKRREKGGERFRRTRPALTEVLTNRVRIHTLTDQADFIRLAIDEVRSAALMGGLLAMLVLLLFLGRLRDTFIVALVIPVSLVCSFAAMNLGKVTLNLMSLGGLALAVGMMVDNAIVVMESIHRRREDGEETVAAAVNGTRIVGGAVTAATLTTVVVFFPIVFVEGVAGQVFGDMALTVVMALLVSLALALFLIPMLTVRTKPTPTAASERGWSVGGFRFADAWERFHGPIRALWGGGAGRRLLLPLVGLYLVVRLVTSLLLVSSFKIIYLLMLGLKWSLWRLVIPVANTVGRVGGRAGGGFRSWFERFTDNYRTALTRAMQHPWRVLTFAALFSAAMYLLVLPRLGGELIPGVSQGVFNVELTLPVGTPLEETAAVAGRLERALVGYRGVREVSSRIGGDLMSVGEASRGSNSAVVTVLLESGGDLEAREEAVTAHARDIVHDIPALEMNITHPTLFTYKQPLELVIKEENLAELRRKSQAVMGRLQALGFLTDITSSVKPGYPEAAITFDRDRLARVGLTPREAADQVRGAVLGNIPTRFRETRRSIDIRVQATKNQRSSLDDLRRLVINTGQTIPLTLEDVAEINIHEGPSQIKRVGGSRAAVLSMGVHGTDLKTADEAIRSTLAELGMEPGYDYSVGGQRREMDKSLRSLLLALLLAVFLVYVVMASQFESLLHPLLILLTVPLAFACLVPVLYLLDVKLSVMVFLGLIVLAGIVVNNSIVLVDYANRLARGGIPPREAVVQAAAVRLRPILMTSLTTVIALLPMALGMGEGVEIRRPMAVTVIFGLTFATLVTLLVIPALFTLFSGISVGGKHSGGEQR